MRSAPADLPRPPAAEAPAMARWLGWTSEDPAVFARMAARAAELGAAGLQVAGLAEPCAAQCDDPADPYPRYTAPFPGIFKFVEAGVMTGAFGRDHVAANAALLRRRSRVLQDAGLRATFYGLEPQYLPEEFFVRHPQLRGPRADHPARSRRARHVVCIDRPEVLAAYREGVAKLVGLCPNLKSIVLHTNDCGGAICWSRNLYAGANGPEGCRHEAFGRRVGRWLAAMVAGGRDAGVADFAVFLRPLGFTAHEVAAVAAELPPGAGLYDAFNLCGGVPSRHWVHRPEVGRKMLMLENLDFGPGVVPLPLLFLEILADCARAGVGDFFAGNLAWRDDRLDLSGELLRALRGGAVPPTDAGRVELLRAVLTGRGIAAQRVELLLEAYRALDHGYRASPRSWALTWYCMHAHLRWDVRPIVAIPSRLGEDERAHQAGIFCAGTREDADDLFWEAGNRMFHDFRDVGDTENDLHHAIAGATRAVALLGQALEGASGDERAFIAFQRDGARFMRCFFETEHCVVTCQKLIDKHTTQFREAYRAQRAIDRGCFLAFARREIANAREWIALLDERPEFAADGARALLPAKIAAMERHLVDADDLFAGWREHGAADDFEQGVMPAGW